MLKKIGMRSTDPRAGNFVEKLVTAKNIDERNDN